MTVAMQIKEMIDLVPQDRLPDILKFIQDAIPDDIDDYASEDDIRSYEIAMQEMANGELIDHKDIKWDN